MTIWIDPEFEIVNVCDWDPEPFLFGVGTIANLDNFTGCTITGGLYQNGVLVAPMTTANGRVIVTLPALVSLHLPLAAVSALPLGQLRGLFQLNTPIPSVQNLFGLVAKVVLP